MGYQEQIVLAQRAVAHSGSTNLRSVQGERFCEDIRRYRRQCVHSPFHFVQDAVLVVVM